MKHRRVLNVGGLGFIGSAITEYFYEQGCEVTVVDSGISNVVDTAYLESRSASIHVIESSIEVYFAERKNISDFDLLIHAASFVGPASILKHQGMIGHQMVSDTALVTEFCLRAGIPLVYFSSAEVYGKSGILFEDSDIRIPPYYNARIEYALAKLTGEAMVLNSHVQGLRSVVIRPFNIVGPRQSRAGGFVMPTFVQQALGNIPLTVFDSGKQTRAFLGIGDLVRFLGDYVTDEVLSNPRVYNVGNDRNETTIGRLAHRVIELLGTRSEIVHVDGKSVYGPLYCEAESFEKLPDIRHASDLGWSPTQSLDEIILETAEFYRAAWDTRGADARDNVASSLVSKTHPRLIAVGSKG